MSKVYVNLKANNYVNKLLNNVTVIVFDCNFQKTNKKVGLRIECVGTNI